MKMCILSISMCVNMGYVWVSDVQDRNSDSNLINSTDIVMPLNTGKTWVWSNLEISITAIDVTFLFSKNGTAN